MSRPEFARTRPHRPSFLVLTLAAALHSCEPESPPGEPTRETLPNGAVLVRYPSLPAIDSVGPEVTEAHVDLRFGSLEGRDPNFAFADIRGIQASSDGNVYVLDFQAAEVRVFDSTGRHLRMIVRRGEGPGEIGEANGIFLSGDTLLWIHDHGRGTIIGVDPHGEEMRRLNKPVSSYDYFRADAFDDLGHYWRETWHLEAEPRDPAPTSVISATGRRYHKSYDLYSRDGDYLGSVRLAFEAAGPIWVRHGNIHPWVVDEFDVPYVVRAPVS